MRGARAIGRLGRKVEGKASRWRLLGLPIGYGRE